MYGYSQYLLILFLSKSIVHLLAQEYTSSPRPTEAKYAALLRSFQLRCQYNGVGDGEFLEWFKKNGTHTVSVNVDKPGHYIVKKNEHESNLTIKIFVESDATVEEWYVETKRNPVACKFSRISLIPSPQGMMDDKNDMSESSYDSIRRTEDQLLNLKCLIRPENMPIRSPVEWQFSLDDKQYDSVPSDIQRQGSEIQIDSVQKYHRGYYRCKLNDVAFTVRLRVKDKLAALWPFLGIVGIILILVIIILIFEKRQKTNNKRSGADEDDHDRPSDPLVRTTTKASDNDNKKRTVKA